MTDNSGDFILTDIETGATYRLPAGSGATLGRDEACDIQVLHSSVSRKHALIEHEGDALHFSDLGSSNGSRVNGAPVQGKQPIQHGDALRLGDVELRLTAVGGAPAAASDDGDMTRIGGAAAAEIPSTWSDSAGLERASQTQFVVKSADAKPAADPLANLAPATAPRLVVASGALSGQVFELGGASSDTETRSWKIGRAAESDIALDESSVSGQHAQLVNEGERWKIVNWMSTNGTIVNGRKALSTYLQNDDRITLGSVDLVFQLPASAQAKAAPAPAPEAKKSGLLGRLFGGKK